MKLLDREFYFFKDISGQLNMTIFDLIHYGANRKLKIGIVLQLDGVKIESNVNFGFDTYYGYNGIYYLDSDELSNVELFQRYSITNYGRFEVKNFIPTRNIYDYITKAELSCDDYPLCYKVIESEICVDVDELIVFSDDVRMLRSSRADETRELSTKEKDSLLKMLITMAIKGYRYNPNDKKSQFTTEIKNDAESLNLSISEGTIRKFIDMAATVLPRE